MTLTTTLYTPYLDGTTNLIYNLLFCDNPDLYQENTPPPYAQPFDILFADTDTVADLQTIINDRNIDPRVRILACNKLLASGHKPPRKELLGVVVEVSLENGLDVLASFQNGTARYINHTGKILVWETTIDPEANQFTSDLFYHSQPIVNVIGPYGKPRRPHPVNGNTRITFLVSDGLYFGEAPTGFLFSDQTAGPALACAAKLMQHLIENAID